MLNDSISHVMFCDTVDQSWSLSEACAVQWKDEILRKLVDFTAVCNSDTHI